MKTIFTAIAASIAAFTVHPAQALPVTVNDISYDVTTLVGAFEDNRDVIVAQVWWDDQALAEDFALTVGNAFGAVNFFGTVGPFFALVEFPNNARPSIGGVGYRSDLDDGVSLTGVNSLVGENVTFAIATPTPVPLPAGFALMLTALAGLGVLRYRRAG